MPTYRQVKLDIEAERVLAPTDWTMDFEEMCGIVQQKTGYSPRTIWSAMVAVAKWDLSHPGDKYAITQLRQNFNLKL